MDKQNPAEVLLDQAYELTISDIDRSRQLAEEAKDLVIDGMPNTRILVLRSYIILAEWYRQRGHYADAVVNFLNAIENYEVFDPDRWFLFALYRLGMTYTVINYHTDAIGLHMQQYSIAKEMENHEEMGNAMRRIGVSHYELQQIDRTIQDYSRSLEHYEAIDDAIGIGGVYNNLALVYQLQSNIPLALDYGRRSLVLFKKANYLRGQAIVHETLTGILVDAENLPEAVHHAAQSLDFAKELKLHHILIIAYLNAGKVYNRLGHMEETFEYYQQALQLAERHHDLLSQKSCHGLLATYYEHLGDYKKALGHYRLHHELEIQSLNNATEARFEVQSILHQTQQAQSELLQQKRLREEEKHHYAQLTQMKDELMSTASHDLKNPLATIQVSTYLLSRHLGDTDERVQDIIKQIDNSVERMRNLIINLLDLARLEMGKTLELKAVSVGDYLQAILNDFTMLAEKKGLKIEFQKPSDKFSMTIDPEQIQQVLRNLLSNACKYTNSGGEIRVSFAQEIHQVRIQVSDSGLGIPEQDLPYIFERFYRVKNKTHETIEGTGLGLAICKSIVEKHKGSITVESKIGEGTIFSVILPQTS